MITSLKLGTFDLMAAPFFVQAIHNVGQPGVAISTTGKGTFAGAKLGISKPQNFKMIIDMMVIGSSFSDLATQRESLETELAKIMTSPPSTLYITKANGITVQVDIVSCIIVSDVDAEDTIGNSFQIELQSEYPYLMGQTLHSSTIYIYQGGGMAIPMGIPLNLGNGGSNEVIVNNAGTYEAYPTIVLNGPITNPSITNTTTGKMMNLAYDLPAGESITIDMFNRTVVLSPGNTSIRSVISGDFFTLSRGNNAIHLGSSNYNAIGNAVLTFRDHYVGI